MGAMSVNGLNTTPMDDTTSLTSLTILLAAHTVVVVETGWLIAGRLAGDPAGAVG